MKNPKAGPAPKPLRKMMLLLEGGDEFGVGTVGKTVDTVCSYPVRRADRSLIFARLNWLLPQNMASNSNCGGVVISVSVLL